MVSDHLFNWWDPLQRARKMPPRAVNFPGGSDPDTSRNAWALDNAELWFMAFIVATALSFTFLALWKPSMVRYMGPDKRVTTVVNSRAALGTAIVLGAIVASGILIGKAL